MKKPNVIKILFPVTIALLVLTACNSEKSATRIIKNDASSHSAVVGSWKCHGNSVYVLTENTWSVVDTPTQNMPYRMKGEYMIMETLAGEEVTTHKIKGGVLYKNYEEVGLPDEACSRVMEPMLNTSNSYPTQVAIPAAAPPSNTLNSLPQVVTVPPVAISTSSTDASQEMPIDNFASSEIKVGNQDFSPSFDCLKSNSGQDRLVCNNKNLSELDVQLSVLYSKARSKTAEKDTLKQEQLQWYKYQRNACSDIECLSNAYQSRIFELSQRL